MKHVVRSETEQPEGLSSLRRGSFAERWVRFWLLRSGLDRRGRLTTRLALLVAPPPHKARICLAYLTPRGYVAPSVVIHHSDLRLGNHVFVDERVVLFQNLEGGKLQIGDYVSVMRDCILETGRRGSLTIGSYSSLHPRCQLNAYKEDITIGSGVMIAPNCTLYSYDHGVAPGQCVRRQPLSSRGPIVIGDEAWLATGVIVLSGVRIGEGAVIGAGSIVTEDVPDGAIAVGAPARVIKMRSDLL
jgi:acetyltransferase-like isoleucine patch superfamily enzyme